MGSVKRRTERRTLTLAFLATAVLAAASVIEASPADLQPAQPVLGGCGVERRAVKTLSDPAARRVSFRPRPTTVSGLRRLRAGSYSIGERSRPVELRTYRIRARLVGLKLEADSDMVTSPNVV